MRKLNPPVYSSAAPFGVRFRVSAGREMRLETRERWFRTSEARRKFANKIEKSDQFIEFVAWSDPQVKS